MKTGALDLFNLPVMWRGRLSHGWPFVFSQPAEKEDINEGGDKRKNPGKHLRKPSRIETVHIARIGRSAGLSTGNAAGKLDSERDLRMGAPKPVRHRGRKNNQQQRKQGYAAFLWRYGLHFFLFGPGIVDRQNPTGLTGGNRVLKGSSTLFSRLASGRMMCPGPNTVKRNALLRHFLKRCESAFVSGSGWLAAAVQTRSPSLK
jgi:hypothetical protein